MNYVSGKTKSSSTTPFTATARYSLHTIPGDNVVFHCQFAKQRVWVSCYPRVTRVAISLSTINQLIT